MAERQADQRAFAAFREAIDWAVEGQERNSSITQSLNGSSTQALLTSHLLLITVLECGGQQGNHKFVVPGQGVAVARVPARASTGC